MTPHAAVEEAATHDDWESARLKRDGAARMTIRSLLGGETAVAMQHALEYDAQDDIMLSISKILDGEGEE